MTRIRSRGFGGQAVVSVVGAVAVVSGTLAALLGSGSPARSVPLKDGVAWVQSRLSASLERLDTGSGSVGYRITTPLAAQPLEIVDDGTTTVLRDPVTGAIRAIDLSGAKAKLTPPTQLAKEARLVSGSGRTYVLMAERGEVAALDPVGLSVGPMVSLGGPLGSAAVDGGGVLWVAVPSLGRIVPVTAEDGRVTVGEHVAAGTPGSGLEVTVSAGKPYGLDRASRMLLRLLPGRVEAVAEVPADASVAPAQGDPADGHVVLGLPGGTILRIDAATGQTTRFPLSGRGTHDLGPPVQGRNRIVVPDLTTGELLVIDAVSGALQAVPVRAGAGRPGPGRGRPEDLRIVAADGGVVANDPASPTAVVVTPDGNAAVVDKGGDAPGDEAVAPAPTPGETPAALPVPTPLPLPGPLAPAPLPVRPAPSGSPPLPVPAGPSTPASTTTTRPPVAPAAVRNLQGVPGDASIQLSWAPGPDVGSPLLGHRAECRAAGRPVSAVEVPAAATVATVDRLTNGIDHTCTVVASNAAGAGPAASTGPIRPLDDVPGAPTAVRVTPGNGALQVTWSPPAAGGASVAGYVVTTTGPGGSTPLRIDGPRTGTAVAGLTNGVAYTVTVRAFAASGAAGPEAPAPGPVTPVGPPSAPRAVVLTPRSQAIVVQWQPPADTGGSPITGYRVWTMAGAAEVRVGASATTATLSGLANGTEYTVLIVAGNAQGESAPSSPEQATPGAPVISGLDIRVTDTIIGVSFAVDWRGASPEVCGVVVAGNGVSNTHTYPCQPTYEFDAVLWDTDFTITPLARHDGGQEARGTGATVRTAPRPVHLTRTMNSSPRDWFYGLPEEGLRYATVQESGIWVYTYQKPGTVAFQRWTNGAGHWYGREGQQGPAGYRVDRTLGYIHTEPAPDRFEMRRFVRPDWSGGAVDCYIQSALEEGGWNDDGLIGYGAPLPRA